VEFPGFALPPPHWEAGQLSRKSFGSTSKGGNHAATDGIIVRERLRCIRESDVAGGSEPYIWPALLWIDDNTLATPSDDPGDVAVAA
jgi:hypothetical protein